VTFPRRYSRPLIRAFFNIFMMGMVVVSLLSQAASAQASSQADDPTPTRNTSSDKAPGWLQMLDSPDQLYSEYSLDTLAGRLIIYGVVLAPDCPNGGLLESNRANECGIQRAMPEMIEWQNRFNASILAASKQTGVPPILIKNIFAWESQFWPQTIFINTYEYGLGHLTEMGADSILRWNQSFYESICKESFSAENCKSYYIDLSPAMQAALRGVVTQHVNADCSNCTYGLDLDRADRSIPIFANTLLANARVVKYYIQIYTGKSASDVVSEEDLWKFTLSSYNAGPGCFKSALVHTYYANQSVNWKNLSSNFDPACRGAIGYVKFVSKTDQYHPEDAPPLQPTVTATEATPTTVTEAPTVSATPTEAEATATPEPDLSPTAVSTEMGTATAETPIEDSATPSSTPSDTPAASWTPDSSVTETPTFTSPYTVTPTATPTEQATATETPTFIYPDTATPPVAPTAQQTETGTATLTLQDTDTPTATLETISPTPIPIEQSTDEIVVKFKGFPASLFSGAVISMVGAQVEGSVEPLGATVLSVPSDSLPQVLQQLQSNILVEYAEPNYAVHAFYTPNDPFFANQESALSLMQIPDAWDVTQGQGVVVAVVDTGIDTAHPDLQSNIWQNPGETGTDANGNDKRTNGRDDEGDGYVDDWQGWNFVNASNNPADDHGHGTHLAGIIAASMDNATGIAGIAPQAKIMALKALDSTGFGTYAQVAEAIVYAVDHGAKVINLGFGGNSPSDVLQAAINYADSHGVLVVAASGNTGDNQEFYPAAYPSVISAASVDNALDLSPFSSYGLPSELVAPGAGIYSTLPDGTYGPMSGTSISSAQVSGVAALVASQPQFDTAGKIRGALIGSALDLGSPGWDTYFGNGLVQALNAINYVPGAVQSPTPTASPTLDVSPTPTDTSGDGGVSIMVDAANANINNYTLTCGTTTYNTAIGGTGVPVIQVNNAISAAIPIGFDFWYMGTRYTQVVASSNGWLSFGAPGGNYATNDLDNATGPNSASARPLLAPLWDNTSGVGGTASYATAGTAPNRTFTFEWWNWQWNTGAGSPVISFKVILHENTGVIDYIYHQNATAVNNPSASIGLTGTANAVFRSAQSVVACPAVTTPEVDTLATKPPEGTRWTFTPPVPSAAPSNLTFSGLSQTGMTLNWVDNSNNEDGFAIYRSTDGVTYTFIAQTAANITSYIATGLTAGTLYYWRVYAVTEGGVSAPLAGSQSTVAEPPTAGIGNYALTCNTTTYNTALGGTGVATVQVDNGLSGVIPIGFDFWYMGTRYTQVYASSNGWLSFGVPAGNYNVNDLDNASGSGSGSARPLLAPLWDNLSGVGGTASYTTAGTAPNRTFTFEWWNWRWGNGAGGAVISFKVILHESTGAIDYIYHQNATAVNAGSASIGLTGTPNTSYRSAQSVVACPTFTTPEVANLNTKPAEGTRWSFASPVPNSPTLLAPTNVTTTAETLNWMDNSANEIGFIIYTSTDGVNYTFVTQTAANVTSYNATGLANSANTYWRVYSVTEGALSAQAAQLNAPSGLTFSDVKTTSTTLNWVDNAANETGYLIYSSTDGINFTLITQTGANTTSYNATGLTAGTTYYWRALAINSGAALSAAATGTQATNTLPVVTITAPADNSTYVKNTPITFTGTATDAQDGIISSGLVWFSNLTGPFGTGASVTVNNLLPGTHIITAKSTDSNGEASTASITITVTDLKGPHGGFNGSTDQCALCHRAHSAPGDTYLTTDSNSVVTSDAFCLSCHTNISTHSNKNWGSAAESPFEVRCIQCHDAHGTSNLFSVNTGIMTSLNPVTTVGPVTFTSLTGSNSFDDGTSANRLCVVCHTSTTHHPGGANHFDGTAYIKDYTGQSCVACHPHNADSSAVTLDGFMPVRSSNP